MNKHTKSVHDFHAKSRKIHEICVQKPFQKVPWGCQITKIGFKGRQARPKGGQEVPKWGLSDPKEAQKASPGGEKGAQGSPKEGKRLPKRLPEKVLVACLEKKGAENCICRQFL